MERKPRPVAAEPARPVSAQDFFEVDQAAPESPDQPAADVVTAAAVDAPVEAEASAVEHEAPPAEEFVTSSDAESPAETSHVESAAVDASEPPPPPPPDDDVAAPDGAPPPPPPATEASEPVLKSKRKRWGFGRSRKSRAEKKHAAEAAAPAASAPAPAAEDDTSTFSGWRVRQPNEDPQPVWQRSHDVAQDPSAVTPESETAGEETSAPAWSATADGEPTAEVETAEAGAAVAVGDAQQDPVSTSDSAEQTDAPLGIDEPEPAEATVAQDDGAHVDAPLAAEDPHQADTAIAADGGVTADAETSATEHQQAAGDADRGFAFASLDEPEAEPAVQASSETWLSDSWLDDVVSGDAPQAAAGPDLDANAVAGGAGQPDAAAGEDAAGTAPAEGESEQVLAPSPASILRTPGPWSWPLAEPDDDAQTGDEPAPSADEYDAADMEPAVVAASKHEDTARIASENGADPGFFHRDEPVGSQYVDFDEVRSELVQIGVVWLGEANAVQVTALLNSTRSTIDDFVATIDTIRGLHIDGQDPASIQAMAREMHQQAAERLCGA
jgi:hypothetical protein